MSSRNPSDLPAGGLRYLQYGDFHLVFEGLTERRRLRVDSELPMKEEYDAYVRERMRAP